MGSGQSLPNFPKLLTKQDVHNILFLDREGKYSYFQNRSGGLYLSTNYKIIPLMQGNLETYYLIKGTDSHKKLILEKINSFFTQYNVNSNHDIYTIGFGNINLKKIGTGIEGTLHLKDTWVSLFNSDLNAIEFKNLENSKLDMRIDLNPHLNPYFIPQVIFYDEENIFYTDMNKKGEISLIHFYRNSQMLKVVFKSSNKNTKLELCQDKKGIILGEFGLSDSSFGSEIRYYSNLESILNNKSRSLYRSMRNDIGNIVCEDKIYFIQDQSREKKHFPTKTEVVSLDFKDSKVNTLTNISYATQIFSMDGRIILPFRESFYLLKGENTNVTDSITKGSKSGVEDQEVEKLIKSQEEESLDFSPNVEEKKPDTGKKEVKEKPKDENENKNKKENKKGDTNGKKAKEKDDVLSIVK